MANWSNITPENSNEKDDEFIIYHQGINRLQKRDVVAASMSNARWLPEGNYLAGSEIQGSDNLWYTAVINTGGDYGNSVNPVTRSDNSVWRLINTTPFIEVKEDKFSPLFYLDGSNIKTQQRFAVDISGVVISFDPEASVVSPALTLATDYKIYALDNGTLVTQTWDSSQPANSKLVGGFHTDYSNGAIVERSIWDFGWRPKCSPRAMVLSLSNRVWADIYLMDTAYGLNGYSRPNAQIADGGSLPIRPLVYGGNGVSSYTSFTQYVARELVASAGKRLPSMADFEDIAYGTVTGQAAGADPVTTKYQAGLRSAIGCEQVTGVMWQWGSEAWDRGAGGSTGYTWYAADTDNKGRVYSAGPEGVGAVLLGGNWGGSGVAGSRCSSWYDEPWYSHNTGGARGFCEHTTGGF